MCPHYHSKISGSQHQGGLVDLSEQDEDASLRAPGQGAQSKQT